MGGFPDQGQPVAGEAIHRGAGERKALDRLLHRDRAEDRLHPVLDHPGQLVGRKLRIELGELRLLHPDERRMPARQRHLGERAGAGMELRRNRLMVDPVAEIQDDGALRVGPFAQADAGGFAHRRASAIGGDDEIDGQAAAVGQFDDGALALDTVAARRRVAALELRRVCRLRLQRGQEVAVEHVVAEGRQTDLAGAELDGGRAQKPAGVVDQAHHRERLGLAAERLEDSEIGQEGDRTADQRRAAPVGRGVRRDQHRVEAGFCQGEGGRGAGQSAADDGYLSTFHACGPDPVPDAAKNRRSRPLSFVSLGIRTYAGYSG